MQFLTLALLSCTSAVMASQGVGSSAAAAAAAAASSGNNSGSSAAAAAAAAAAVGPSGNQAGAAAAAAAAAGAGAGAGAGAAAGIIVPPSSTHCILCTATAIVPPPYCNDVNSCASMIVTSTIKTGAPTSTIASGTKTIYVLETKPCEANACMTPSPSVKPTNPVNPPATNPVKPTATNPPKPAYTGAANKISAGSAICLVGLAAALL